MNWAEVLRKLLHMVALCIPFGMAHLPRCKALTVFALLTSAILAGELLRKKWGFLQRLFVGLFGSFLRPSEKLHLTGATYFFISGLICLLLFDMPIAYTAMAFMIVGDAAAALVGMRFGRIRLNSGKTLEGTAACICACLLFWLFFPQTGFSAALVGAFLTGALELVPVKINDNLFVPVVCAFILQIFTGF